MLILFTFWLVYFSFSAEPLPLLQTTCANNNEVYNTSEYGCYPCPNNFRVIENVCRPINESLIDASSKIYVNECGINSTKLGLVCFPDSIIESYKNQLKEVFIATYHDVIRDIKSKRFDRITTQITDEYIEQFAWADLFHRADPFNQTAVSFISNACAVFSYDLNAYPCALLYGNFTQGLGGKYGYLFWPSTGPFITYGENVPLKYISEEDYITKSYKLGEYTSFQLGRFSKYGEFKGFTKLTIDFNKCGDSNNVVDFWQKYGYNYYSNCYVDMTDLISADSTDFFDPFIEDGEIGGVPILRPVPVIIKNYRGMSGVDVNRASSDSNYRAVRRFFMNDNYTSNEIVQHMKSFIITFNAKKNNKNKFYPPIFTIEYSQIYRDQLNSRDFIISIDEETISSPKYIYEVKYLRPMNNFWTAALILLFVLIAVGLVYYFFIICFFTRVYGVDGSHSNVIIGGFGHFFDIISTILFVIAFAFSFYILCFFKFQKSSFIFLPEEDEFQRLIPTLLVTLGMKLIAIIFFIVLKSSTSFFIIDWEEPKEQDIPISGWRRIIVANELNRIMTVRHYNVAFTVLTITFIIGGFNLELLATPIPTTKLVDMDKQYYVIRFAFLSFIWLLLMLFQYLITNFVLWPIFGNPFLNFVDLCSTSNISVLIRCCSAQGFYIHGKNPNNSADGDLDELKKNFNKEKNGLTPKRGLINDTTDQVFKAYLSKVCRGELNELYSSQLAQTGAPSALNFKKHVAADIPHASYELNKEVNDYLKKFFTNQLEENNFVVQQKNFIQDFFDFPPTIIEDSIMMIVGDTRYYPSLLAGIEWKLQLLYLLVFACVNIWATSPCIPAIVVYVIDVIFVKIFNFMGRSNLSKKTLLDDRFFL